MNFAYFKKHSTLFIIVAVAVVIVATLAARAVSKKTTDESAADSKPLVQLLKVSDFSQNSHAVNANGTVESLQQVDLKSQTSGKITRINVKVGDKVKLGQVLAIVDQSNAAAALTSAQGGLAQAQANLNKLLAGASSEQIDAAKIAVDNAQTSLTSTKASQDTAVANSFSTLLNTAVSAIASPSNPDTVTPVITGTYTGTQEGVYTIKIYSTGQGLKFQLSGLESANGDVKNQPVAFGSRGLYIQFNTNPTDSDTWTVAIPNTYSSGYVPNYNAYQTALKTRDALVAAAQGALNTAQAALTQLQAQARPADVQAAQAQILIAQGQVQAASAAYDNTLVKAPFDGNVSALPVKLADSVSPGQKVATVVNQGGLQIKVFVSSADLPFIKINATAQIGENKATGTVTNIAPSVDAITKTAEVDIAVTNPEASGLTVGQNTSIVILSDPVKTENNSYILPLQAVKLTPDNKAFVYSLNDNKAKEIEVKIGTVDGEHVEVLSGLENVEAIISNVYDVSNGDSVQIQQ